MLKDYLGLVERAFKDSKPNEGSTSEDNDSK